MNWFRLFLVSILIFASGMVNLNAAGLSEPSWQSKIEPVLLATAQEEDQIEFLVWLNSQADLSESDQFNSKTLKGDFVYQALSQHAEQAQAPVISELQQLGLEYRSYWIVNLIWVRGNAEAIQRLAQRPEVGRIVGNPAVRLEAPQPSEPQDAPIWPRLHAPTAVEQNLIHVTANLVWNLGFQGENVVIGGQDTGYQWNHPALINQYRGWDGNLVDHSYNWHDAIHNPNTSSSCGFDSVEACDDHGHGTHTMGIMVGDDHGSNQIGMAPSAQWIGCRNMDRGVGTPQTYIECYQWFVAPTDLARANPDPSKAPHIINNSWACPPSEGCTAPEVLLAAVQNVRAAGILTVHSAGNSGPNCGSIDTPGAIYDESFTVGNTTSNDAISFSSSRGPVFIDGSGRLKPDISAPGTGIRSSYPHDTYRYLSGTSMAAPHVAGLAALLISARPDLAGEVGEIEHIITTSAVPLTASQNCGEIAGTEIPNNTFGWGRINALAAIQEATGILHLDFLPIIR